MSLDMLGADNYLDTIFSTAGGLLSAGGQIAQGVQASDAAKNATASDKAKLQAAITADSAAALALAAALKSQALAASAPTGKMQSDAQAKVTVDQAAADLASQAEDVAAAQVPVALMDQRVAAAQKGLQTATAKLQATPTEVYAQALQKAWQQVLNKVQNKQITASAPDAGKGGKDKKDEGGLMGWFKEHSILSAAPNYAVVGGGVGIVGAIWFAAKKGLFHKLGIG
jgi:hypothetical protein